MTSNSRLKIVLETIKVSGKITPELLKHLSVEEKDLVQTLFDQGMIEDTLSYMESLDSTKAWNELMPELEQPEKSAIPLWRSVMRYAAVVVGVVALGYMVQTRDQVDSGMANQVLETNGIKLLLGKDEIKFLTQQSSEEISNSSGQVVAQYNANSITYLNNPEIKDLVFHEIEVPYGKIFDLTLSDGTVVHLNSGTKMRYPIQFLKGQKREVQISGEAYFDVAKDKEHPFVVSSDDIAIEVLGTQFNFSTYKEESVVDAVLVEGAIKMINSRFPDEDVVLVPGTRGSWNKVEHKTTVEEVDVSIYTGWMKGEMIFKNSTFEEMAKRLERRYDVKIENRNSELSKKVFNASFSKRIESFEDVLIYLSEVSSFRYEIKNNSVIIY